MATLGEGLCTSIAYAEAALYGLPTQRVWRTIAEYINEVTRRAFALDAGGIRLDMSGTAESGVVAVSHPRRNTTIVEIPAGLAGEMPWGEPGRALVGAIVSAAAAEAHAPQRVAQVMSDYDATPESPIFGRPFPGEGFRLG